MEQKPSIGRIVHYASKAGPQAALVVDTFDDGSVSLTVFWNIGGSKFFEGVKFDATEAPGTWRWPPRT